MSEKQDKKDAAAAAQQALVDHVIAGYQKPADLIGENGLLKQLTKRIFEAALKAEMAELRPPVRRCQNLAGLNLLTGFSGIA